MLIYFVGTAFDACVLTLIDFLSHCYHFNCKIALLLIYSGALLVDLIELDPVLMRFIYCCQDWTGLTFDNIMDDAEKIRIAMMHCGMINRFGDRKSVV